MPKEKKIPLRTCIACRETKEKKELVRVVRTSEGEIFADFTGKSNGRGAYLCKSEECFRKLKKQRLLNKTFSLDVSEETYDKIGEAIFAEQ